MKIFCWLLLLLVATLSFAQDSQEIVGASENAIFKKASTHFSQGKYQATVDELTSLEGSANRVQSGLIHYWKGLCYNRLQDYSKSISEFDLALGLDYKPTDIHYEYGQALFAAEKLQEARLQFRESLKVKFKRAVSLYYIAYISKEVGDKKKAVTFYKAVKKLGPEAQEVLQASEMQIGDIYLEQIEKHKDAFRAVEKYVIPQYELALEVDKESNLAPVIKEKIIGLQRKYDLILFNLRNGRPVLNPPYFLRLAQEVGVDSNVTFSPTENEISKSKQASTFSKTDFIGRYTFYHQNFLSIAPELRANYTRYFNRVPEIYRNDNYLIAPAIRSGYEHSWRDKPATFLFDYEYSSARRDVEAKKKLEFSSRSHTLMIGERFNYFQGGESIIRLRHRMFESYLSASDAETTSLVFEQIKGFTANTLLFYFSYDRTRVKNDEFDTDSLTFRTDLIMSRIGNLFTPSFGLGLTSTDPINDRASRGRELLINPSARLSKMFGRNWRGNLKYDYQKNNSKDEERFAYNKQIYSFELEYLF